MKRQHEKGFSNIGKFLILKYFPDKLSELIRHSTKEPERPRTEIEKEIIGVSHAQLGAFLLDWWNLPLPLIEACLYHHDPLNDRIIHKELTALIHISDCYAWKFSNKAPGVEIDNEVFKTAGVTMISAQEAFTMLKKLNLAE